MRYIGIDYGKKRIGTAISDEAGEFALPLIVLQNDKSLLPALQKIIAEKKIGAVVLGESKNFEGKNNVIMSDILKFKEKLEAETGLKVHLEPEFMTSTQANRMNIQDSEQSRRSGVRLRRPQVKNAMLDASAAAIILKSYLDKKINTTKK